MRYARCINFFIEFYSQETDTNIQMITSQDDSIYMTALSSTHDPIALFSPPHTSPTPNEASSHWRLLSHTGSLPSARLFIKRRVCVCLWERESLRGGVSINDRHTVNVLGGGGVIPSDTDTHLSVTPD
jgi:hypothetical protein